MAQPTRREVPVMHLLPGRRCALSLGVSRALFAAMLAPMAFAPAALAQTYGPGPVPPLTIPGGTQEIVGDTTITATTSTHAVQVTGGTLTINTQTGPTPGAITLVTQNGNGLFVNGGTANVPSGVNIFTVGGHAVVANGAGSLVSLTAGQLSSTGVGAGLVAIGGGVINANSTTINNLANAGTGTISNGHGAIAESGGRVNLLGTTQITTNAFNAVALGASGANSLVTLAQPATLTMNGTGSMGVYLHDGGQVQTAANTTFTMNGFAGIGVAADNTANTAGLLGSGLTVNFASTPGSGQVSGTGAVAFNGGALTLDTFRVTGPGAGVGVWSTAGTTITLTGNSNIDIQSANNAGYYRLVSNNLATVNGPVGAIFGVTAGLPNAGLKSQGSIFSTGTTVTVSAANAYGGYAEINTGTATLDLTNNTITTTGTGTAGLFAGSNGVITGRDSRVSTTGGGSALRVATFNGPGSIDLTNSTVTATGALTKGIYSLNYTPGLVNNVALHGGTLTSQYVAILGNGPLNVTADSGASIRGDQWLMYAQTLTNPTPQASIVNLFANDATLEGTAGADASGTANIVLNNGSHWTGEAYYLSNATIDATSLWTVPSDSLVTQTLRNAGRIEFTAPVGGVHKELWTRDYDGTGGTLAVYTYLGTDGSPSDKLILNNGGRAQGAGLLEVTNTDGPGDLTYGNGILVVQAIDGATTAANLFALSSRVIAGPYEYTLQRGSVNDAEPENWYLRSSLDCSGPNAPVPPCPAPDPDPPPDPDPTPPDPPPPTPDPPPDPPPVPVPPDPDPEPPTPPLPPLPPPVPQFRDEVSLYSAIAPTALQYGKSLLDTLHERVGEQEQLRGRDELEETDRIDGFWGRLMYVDGEKDAKPYGIYGGDGPSYDYTFGAVQLGVDLMRKERDNGARDHAGIYGAIGYAETQVEHVFHNMAGDVRTDGYTIGGYWTRYSERDAYLDGILQATWYDVDAHSRRDVTLSTEGVGLAASIEGGYPFRTRNDWIIEPQGQLIYQWLDLDDTSDTAADVRFTDTESLVGRLSAKLSRSWGHPGYESGPLTRTGWARIGVWYDFMGDPVTEFSSRHGFVPFHSDMGGGWWEVEVGYTGDLDRNRFLYTNIGYQQGFDDDRRSWEAKLGFRANW